MEDSQRKAEYLQQFMTTHRVQAGLTLTRCLSEKEKEATIRKKRQHTEERTMLYSRGTLKKPSMNTMSIMINI